MRTKRLFIAIELPEEIRTYVHKVCRHFEQENLFKGRCVSQEHMHITLKFLGNIAENTIASIQTVLAKIRMTPFTATLQRLCVFQTKNIIKILYIDVHSPKLIELAQKIDTILEPFAPRDMRPFLSHITLARIKNIPDIQQFLQEIEQYPIEPLQCNITEFVLEESILTREGPVHTILKRYILKV